MTNRPRRARRAFAVGAAAVVAVAAMASTSGAAVENATPKLQIRAIDAGDGNIVVDYMYRGDGDPRQAKVTIDGAVTEVAAQPLTSAGVRSSVAVVLDNSNHVSNATVQLAMEDMAAIAPGPEAIAELGVVTSGNGARTLAQPATDMSNVRPAFEDVIPKGESALWDAIVMAAKMTERTAAGQRNVVVVAAAPDSGSVASYSNALAAMRDAGATIHVIAVRGSGADLGALRELVTRLGGSFQTGSDEEFATLFGNVAALVQQQYRVQVANVGDTGAELESLRLAVGSDTVAASFRPGVLSVGAEQVKPVADIASGGAGLFGSSLVKYLIVVLVALGAAAGFFAVANLITKRRDGLKYTLRHYDESYGGPEAPDPEEANLAKSAVQRAVEVTETIASDRGVLVRVENLLERADLPLRAAEALTFYVVGAIASVIVTFVMTGSPFVALGVVLAALIAPGFVVDLLAKRRKSKFNAMLPDMLQLLAGTLRAGYSIGQGVEAVSTEVDEPMGKELRRAVTEARLGRPLDEALEAVAHRMDSEDFGWAVMAIRIQREVGGNLAELLMTVSDTMVQRERLRRDVASLTAEGRMSAIILGLLPPGLGAAMWVMNPDYISKLFSGTGLVLLVASIVMMIIGFIWMKKTITIEV